MLSVRPKITEHSFHLFARSLHPELFEVCAQRELQQKFYRLKISITRDGHLIQFRHGNTLLTEVTAAANQPLPSQANLITQPVQRSGVNLTKLDSIDYRSSVEMEFVDPKMFVLIAQQLDSQLECEGLIHRFESNGRIAMGAVSYMHVQSFERNVLIRAIHTFPDSQLLIKSESRFAVSHQA